MVLALGKQWRRVDIVPTNEPSSHHSQLTSRLSRPQSHTRTTNRLNANITVRFLVSVGCKVRHGVVRSILSPVDIPSPSQVAQSRFDPYPPGTSVRDSMCRKASKKRQACICRICLSMPLQGDIIFVIRSSGSGCVDLSTYHSQCRVACRVRGRKSGSGVDNNTKGPVREQYQAPLSQTSSRELHVKIRLSLQLKVLCLRRRSTCPILLSLPHLFSLPRKPERRKRASPSLTPKQKILLYCDSSFARQDRSHNGFDFSDF